MRHKTILIFILSLLILNGCSKELQDQQSENNDSIGGQRDSYGCLTPAGYSYNETIGACIREWELNDMQRAAAKIAVDYRGKAKGLTIISVENGTCKGEACYIVHIETSPGNTIDVFIGYD